ncbi:MAG: ABC transporter ATP-binding protein [Acidobacteriota bacterium]
MSPSTDRDGGGVIDTSAQDPAGGVSALSLRGVTKRYGDFELGPLDLELEAGTVLAFVGPNGAGKTTTLHAIMGLVTRDEGAIEIFGRANDPQAVDWKRDVGFVGEARGFYRSWTVEKNLAFLARFHRDWKSSEVHALARRLDLNLKKPVRALSEGGRSKLSMVAALAHRPRLLLLDEPTKALDPVVRAEVLDLLWERLEDGETSILYSTHVLSDISRLADEIAFMREGRLVERKAKDLLTDVWRRVSFRFSGELPEIVGARSLRSSGGDHQLVTSNFEATGEALRSLGARNVQESRMTIDEIAVEILKEKHRAGAH